MRTRCIAVSALVAALLLPATAAQAAIQIDMSSKFNADVIVNGDSQADLDTTQSSVDNVSYAFATQKILEEACTSSYLPTAEGLPNNGFFGSNGDHPDVQLAYRNSSNGNNVRRTERGDQFSITIPKAKYKKVHLFMMSGDGDSNVQATFTYGDDTTQVKTFTVQDWFDEPTDPDHYKLASERDRMTPNGANCDNSEPPNGANLFGIPLKPNKEKKLEKITIANTSFEAVVLNTFGALAIKP